MGHTEIIKIFIHAGANIDEFDSIGCTPLIYAVESQKVEVVQLLLLLGASANSKSPDILSPLHLACGSWNVDIVQMLLEAGANPNAKYSGFTPLQVAEFMNSMNIVEFLKTFLKPS